MTLRGLVAILFAATLFSRLCAEAQDGVPSAPSDGDARATRFAERDRLAAQAAAFEAAGKTEAALQALSQALAIEEEIYGAVHDEVAETLRRIATLQRVRGDIGAWREAVQRRMAIQIELHGSSHWTATDARLDLEDTSRWESLSTEQRSLLTQVALLTKEASQLWTAGARQEALQLAEKSLAIQGEILGRHRMTADGCALLGSYYSGAGDYRRAELLYRRALEIRGEILGAEHPEYARSLDNLGLVVMKQGKYREAEPLLCEALAIRERVLGERHPDYACSLNNLGWLYQIVGRYQDAEQLLLRAVDDKRRLLGEMHPECATSLTNLARLLDLRGEFAEAEPLFQESLEIWRKAFGEQHEDFAMGLNNLGTHYLLVGHYAEAETLFRRALAVWRVALGETHTNVATCLNNLAQVYMVVGDYEKAEECCRQALEVRREVLGEGHYLYGQSLNNLGTIYLFEGSFAKADVHLRQALEVWREALGESHQLYAHGLNNLAGLCRSVGEWDEAVRLYGHALTAYEQAVGEDHPAYAQCLNNLGHLYLSIGNLAEAEPPLKEALTTRLELLGGRHPDIAQSLSNLGLLHSACGERDLAALELRQALDIRRSLLDASFAVLSERQQFQMTGQYAATLSAYLAVSSRVGTDAGESYASLLPWKGSVFSRQVRARAAALDPASAGLLAKYERTCRSLATLCLAAPKPEQQEASKRQIAELDENREELERELTQRSAAFRDVRAMEQLAPAQLQASLPADVVLVDFLEYRHGPKEECHIVAFVIPSKGTIRRVELGPVHPVAEAIEAWRARLERHMAAEAAQKLAALVWEPLDLKAVRTVLVSPDGVLNRLAFSALPGSKPGTYLVEEVAIAVIPVPQLLPQLLEAPVAQKPSLLLLGEVDYRGSPGATPVATLSRSASGFGRRQAFRPLDGTRAEIAAIRDSFELRYPDGRVRMLRRKEATEASFREEASGYRWLHLATHGFFTPPEVPSAIHSIYDETRGPVGYHPGVLSGLALAGANTPHEPEGDDGILTALEVAALDLTKVECAVLSACDTGLGEVAAGEGVLGLQRAFQTAGAKTTITSLWAVPDIATQLLMQRFYENLWDKGMSKLEALREAQLWLMREGPKRGVALADAEPEPQAKTLPPYFWAAFVLSGDWR